MDYKQIFKSYKTNKVEKLGGAKTSRHIYNMTDEHKEALITPDKKDEHQFLKKKPDKRLPPQNKLFVGATRQSKRLQKKKLKK